VGRIVLLVQMHEEPQAIKLVGESGNGDAAADDYLVCPLSAAQLLGGLSPDAHRDRPERRTESVPAALSRQIGEEASRKKRTERLERLATEDDLTGLKNRRYIWEFSRQLVARAKQDHGRVTLLVFDIDNFKHYNDEYGHAAGDAILRQAGVMMQRCCRRHDVVGRVGGDEFAVVFWDDPTREKPSGENERRVAGEHPREVIAIARRFQREFGHSDLDLLGPDGRGTLTISGGLASLWRDGDTTEELFGRADEALLEAKRSGKNRIYLVGGPTPGNADTSV
jgi:PleD family two-component response regulator